MRHVVAGEKSVLLGDAVTDLLVQYAALVVQQHTADTIDLAAFDSTGTSTILTLLLDEGMPLAAEQIPSSLEEPDNRKAEELLRSRIDAVIRQQSPTADEIAGTAVWNTGRSD